MGAEKVIKHFCIGIELDRKHMSKKWEVKVWKCNCQFIFWGNIKQMERFSCGTYYDRIGGNVRRIRMEKGLTQERLAEEAELSLAAVQKVETGQSGLRLETLIRIALVLGVSLDILAGIGENDEKYRFQQEVLYLLIKDKSISEVKYAIAVIDSIFKYKDEFLD